MGERLYPTESELREPAEQCAQKNLVILNSFQDLGRQRLI